MAKPSQGVGRNLVLEEEIGRCNVGSNESASASFRIDNPSVRLHLTVAIFARPNKTGAGTGGGAHDYTGETWQLYIVADGTPSVRTNAVFVNPATGLAAAVALPDTYEGQTGAKVIEGDVELVDNNNGNDSYFVQCIWEPAEGGERMTDKEWADLKAGCKVKRSQTKPAEVA